MTYAMLAFGIICSGLFVWTRDKRGGAGQLVLKIASSAFFALTAFAAYIEGPFGAFLPAFVLMGMFFAFGGDVALDMKITYPADQKSYTYTGMILFTITQIFYTAALGQAFSTHWAVFVGAAVFAAAVMAASRLLLKQDFGKFFGIASIYAFALCITVAQSLFALITKPDVFTSMFFAGAALFLISDGILSMTYFGGKDGKAYIAANHVAYYAAQFLIALSILFYAG